MTEGLNNKYKRLAEFIAKRLEFGGREVHREVMQLWLNEDYKALKLADDVHRLQSQIIAQAVAALQGILDAERNGRFHPKGIKASRAEALYNAEKTLEKIGQETA